MSVNGPTGRKSRCDNDSLSLKETARLVESGGQRSEMTGILCPSQLRLRGRKLGVVVKLSIERYEQFEIKVS
jgi:hypothetical protein